MSYTANDIVSLSQGRAFREKIGMYLSADRQQAINLGLRELIVNVQDEYEVFKPTNPYMLIELDTKERTIRTKDNMRGIPVGVRDDGINSLTASFLISHSGAKHREGVYSSSVGINGVGNKVVCHTSEWLQVWVNRDGNRYFQEFKETDEGAIPMDDVKVISKSKETGTEIFYKPSKKVYQDYFIDLDTLRNTLKEISYFTIGLKIVLKVDGVEEIFISKRGLIDGLESENTIGKPFSFFHEESDCKVELALQWVSKKGNIRGYANGLHMPDGGEFITGFKTSLTRTFNSLAGKQFSGDQIRNVLSGFVSVKVRVGQFSNQAKTALANKEARTATSSAISAALKEFYSQKRADFDKVVELLTKTEKAEIAAEKARQAVLNHTKEISDAKKKKVIMPDKLKDAEKLGEDSILLVVEGDSAAGSMTQSRDTKKYGVLALRGKVINCLSNPIEDILENKEVKLFLMALGVNINKYNPKDLRYGKVAIAVDADDDGSHIACLIMALVRKLIPQFLNENRLYWLKAPLYKVTQGKKRYYYYDDTELSKGVKGEIIRYKGLGQMNPCDVEESMFHSEFQRLEQLTVTDEGIRLLEALMGEDVAPRKEFVFNEIDFSKYGEV